MDRKPKVEIRRFKQVMRQIANRVVQKYVRHQAHCKQYDQCEQLGKRGVGPDSLCRRALLADQTAITAVTEKHQRHQFMRYAFVQPMRPAPKYVRTDDQHAQRQQSHAEAVIDGSSAQGVAKR